MCLQENMGTGGGFKFFYHDVDTKTNSVRLILTNVVTVKRVSDNITSCV